MALNINTVLIMLFIVNLVSVASAISGTATFYTKLSPSACFWGRDEGTMITAASKSIWKNGAAWGKKIRVRCIGGTTGAVAHPCRHGSITVKIVDLCLNCQGTIDLSRQAFAAIANPVEGKIALTSPKYEAGACGFDGESNVRER